MKTMSRRALCGLCAMLACVLAAIGTVGCDESESTGVIIVTPPEVILRFASNTVTLVASLPEGENNTEFFGTTLEWSVEDPELGEIQTSAGTMALYVRTKKDGDNYVYVEDGYGRTGWAVIRQY